MQFTCINICESATNHFGTSEVKLVLREVSLQNGSASCGGIWRRRYSAAAATGGWSGEGKGKSLDRS